MDLKVRKFWKVKLPAYKAGHLSKARKAFIPAHRAG
jgi:hypothetical protein